MTVLRRGGGEETEEKSFLGEGEKMVQRKKRESSCVPAGKDSKRHLPGAVLEDRKKTCLSSCLS